MAIEEKDNYKLLYILDDTIKKYSINADCSVFGVIGIKQVIDDFIQSNPEYNVKETHSVAISASESKDMTIIEMKPAIMNMKKLAEEGNSKIAYELGMMYEKGKDVSQNFMALKYYRLSSKSKSQEAVKRLMKIFSILKDVCPICLEQYDMRTDFCSASCSHSFHLSCLVKAMKQNNNCPVCRQSLNFKIQKEVRR